MKAIQYRSYGDYSENRLIELPRPQQLRGPSLRASAHARAAQGCRSRAGHQHQLKSLVGDQIAQSGTQLTASADTCSGSEPKFSIMILEEMLEDVRRALAHDRKVAQAGIARLSAMLEEKEIAPAVPRYIRGGF